jgi:hypothetical protein
MLGGSAAMVHVSNTMYGQQQDRNNVDKNNVDKNNVDRNPPQSRNEQNTNFFSKSPPEYFKPCPPPTNLPTAKREMRGPQDVDDVLKELEQITKKRPTPPQSKNRSLDNKSKISVNENGRRTIKLNI